MAPADRARDSTTALTRFGLGARPGERRAIADDPRGFVLAQISKETSPALPDQLPASPELFASMHQYRADAKQRKMPPAADSTAKMAANGSDGVEAGKHTPAPDAYRAEEEARATHAITTDRGFVERLVMFWSNFFAVSADRDTMVMLTAGAFEREAIRPHVFGRFGDMLLAATRHPTMLFYLNNNLSVGPHSRAGASHRTGLNENLARETLELHSVGVHGGYSQADVTELARIITGWRTARERDDAPFGQFFFDARAHEPGSFIVLGRSYPPGGVEQGLAVIADLAAHPATAMHVATRLARHFVSDTPSDDLVARLAAAFRDSDGDLAEVARALARADPAWQANPAKFLPPYDFIVAAERLAGGEPNTRRLMAALRSLGQRMWAPPSPAGWPDDDNAWTAPDALFARVGWSVRMAAAAARSLDIGALASDILGPRLTDMTREAIARAESRPQALALLLASSEFQTR